MTLKIIPSPLLTKYVSSLILEIRLRETLFPYRFIRLHVPLALYILLASQSLLCFLFVKKTAPLFSSAAELFTQDQNVPLS